MSVFVVYLYYWLHNVANFNELSFQSFWVEPTDAGEEPVKMVRPIIKVTPVNTEEQYCSSVPLTASLLLIVTKTLKLNGKNYTTKLFML